MKITELLKLQKEAEQLVEEGKAYNYRYGQALYNIIPIEIAKKLTRKNDFFYWRDDRKEEINSICLSLCEDFKPVGNES